ncbi:MAG TPA: DNA polymerase I [Vicinamibacterales bacterium]|nr:DNA polymerase I [Vicinamibacterales bacterium]
MDNTLRSSTRPVLFLVDGNSQMYRAYHAIRGLTGPDGRSTNAVYGFVTMLRKLIADQRPELIACAFDLAGPTFRTSLAADYKANRPTMPDDLAAQIPWVHRACEAMGVPLLSCRGFEADDVIATVAERATSEGYQVAIVTGDKDMFQLVRDGVRVFNPKEEGAWFDADAVRERFGVPPERVVDVLALTGDAIDNIQGVQGIGEKGARSLISEYGTLDELLARAGEVPQKKYRQALIEQAEAARSSRELARLRRDAPISFEIERFRYRGPDRAACFAIFSELGFRTLLTDYAPTAETVERDYQLVDSPEALRLLVDELRAAGAFALRALTTPGAAVRAGLVGLAVALAPRRARYIPVGHRTLESGPQMPAREVLEALRPLLEDEGVGKVGHDLKADVVVLARHGITLRGLRFDTMLASYVLDATRSSHPLEVSAIEHLGYQAATEESVCGRGSRALGLEDLPPPAILAYAGERADLPLQLAAHFAPALASEGLEPVYRELELPLVPVLAALERAGVKLDGAVLAGLSGRVERDLTERTTRIFELAGESFNINSPRQLSEILFEKLKLPASRRTGKTRVASTAVEVLEELALAHELPRLILEWRGLQKLKGTYIDALPELVNPETGRVHTCFNQAVAATGRLSSSEPNLQNIPIRTELGREIRAAFIPEPGHVIVSADYSQIELRVLAHLSGDAALIEAFRRGDDIHDQTALKVFGADSGLDPHELRRRAKVINYALLYGKTAFTLARDIGVTQQAAQAFIDAYFAGFPGVRRFIDALLAEARDSGFVKTLFGRRRPVPELTSRNGQVRAAAERVAVNLPIQGTAADILKKAMVGLHRALEEHAARGGRARMILTVHDELVFEAPREEADAVAVIVKEGMESAAPLAVPLTVEVGIGGNWREAKG